MRFMIVSSPAENAGELDHAVQRIDRAAYQRGADLLLGRVDDADVGKLLERLLARGDRRRRAATRGRRILNRRSRRDDLALDDSRSSARGQDAGRLDAPA